MATKDNGLGGFRHRGRCLHNTKEVMSTADNTVPSAHRRSNPHDRRDDYSDGEPERRVLKP